MIIDLILSSNICIWYGIIQNGKGDIKMKNWQKIILGILCCISFSLICVLGMQSMKDYAKKMKDYECERFIPPGTYALIKKDTGYVVSISTVDLRDDYNTYKIFYHHMLAVNNNLIDVQYQIPYHDKKLLLSIHEKFIDLNFDIKKLIIIKAIEILKRIDSGEDINLEYELMMYFNLKDNPCKGIRFVFECN